MSENRQRLRNSKTRKRIFARAITTLALIAFPTFSLIDRQAEAQSSGRINWGEICRNPIVDAVITEDCSTLTTPDGYTLTPQGEQVIRCLAGGTVLILVDPSLQTLLAAQALGPAVGCGNVGSSSNQGSSSNAGNGLLGILDRLLGK